MEPPLDRSEFERWRSDAENALAGARREAAAGAHNWSCFLAEQAAQLALKGLLHGIGKGPWGHDLVTLTDLARNAGLEVPTELAEALRRLGKHYITTRYPDAHPAGPAGPHYGDSESTEAVRDAERVLAYVDRTWNAR